MARSYDPDIEVESIVLEQVRVALHRTVSNDPIFLQNPSVRVQQLAHVADEFVVILQGWFTGKKFPDRSEWAEVESPAGWWEMLKSERAPKWFLKRWPVKTKITRYESCRYHYNVCPHASEDYNKDKWPHMAFMAERQNLNKKHPKEQ